MKVRALAAAVAAVAVAVAIGVWHWSASHAPSPDARKPPSVQLGRDAIVYPTGAPQLAMLRSEPVRTGGIPMADALAARVAYDEDLTARLFAPVSGRIVSLQGEAGDRVSAGQVLAEIDSPDFGTARADLDKAKADEERKRLAYERAKELGPGEGIAVKDVEAARADYGAAQAETARAAQRVKNLNSRGLKLQGQRLAITSPLTGVVAERSATPALEVAPGGQVPLFVVSDLHRLWLLIDLPEKLLPLVKSGARVLAESDAYPGEQFPARIIRVGQVVDPNSRRVLARALVENPDGKLLPEMFVRALVLQDAGQGARVPNTALVTRGVYSYVFVEKSPGLFERRKVGLSVRGAEFSYVTSGIAAGEEVVTTGALLLDAEVGAGAGQ